MGQQIGGRYGDHRGAQHHAHTEQQGVADRLHIFCVCDGLPRLIQVKAAIYDDRLGKNCDQRAENQAGQKCQQKNQREILFPIDLSHKPSTFFTYKGC